MSFWRLRFGRWTQIVLHNQWVREAKKLRRDDGFSDRLYQNQSEIWDNEDSGNCLSCKCKNLWSLQMDLHAPYSSITSPKAQLVNMLNFCNYPNIYVQSRSTRLRKSYHSHHSTIHQSSCQVKVCAHEKKSYPSSSTSNSSHPCINEKKSLKVCL